MIRELRFNIVSLECDGLGAGRVIDLINVAGSLLSRLCKDVKTFLGMTIKDECFRN